MMLPAVSATPLDAVQATSESAADSVGCQAAFSAAIAQLREAAIPASAAPDTLSVETVATIEAVAEDATFAEDAIDWLLGQCTVPVIDSMPVPPGDDASVAVSGGSTPASSLMQMLAIARGAFSGAPPGVLVESAALDVVDSMRPVEAQWVDTLLYSTDKHSEAGEGAFSLDSTRPGAVAIEANPSLQPGRTEAPPKVATAALHTPVGSRAWSDELATKLTWLIDRGEQLASIRVSPESLGPIDIRIAVREGEASIWFGASQADTRQAIEQAIPRLREMLASQGLSLADAGVFQQAPNDPHRALLRNELRRASQESGETAPATSSVLARRPGLIDDYA